MQFVHTLAINYSLASLAHFHPFQVEDGVITFKQCYWPLLIVDYK